MLQPLKITLVICYTVLALSVAGVLLSGILGRLEWLALCAVCALALLSITLVSVSYTHLTLPTICSV